MSGLFSLVGRAGFEPATNGLKVRRAAYAKPAVRGGFSVHGAPKAHFSPICGQKSPHKSWTDDQHVDKIRLSTWASTETIPTEPSSSRIPSLNWQGACPPGTRELEGFRVSGRCFVMQQHGSCAETRVRFPPSPDKAGMVVTGTDTALETCNQPLTRLKTRIARWGRVHWWGKPDAGFAPGLHHKASSTSGREIDAAHGPVWAAPRKHQPRLPVESRPGVGKATGTRDVRQW